MPNLWGGWVKWGIKVQQWFLKVRGKLWFVLSLSHPFCLSSVPTKYSSKPCNGSPRRQRLAHHIKHNWKLLTLTIKMPLEPPPTSWWFDFKNEVHKQMSLLAKSHLSRKFLFENRQVAYQTFSANKLKTRTRVLDWFDRDRHIDLLFRVFSQNPNLLKK